MWGVREEGTMLIVYAKNVTKGATGQPVLQNKGYSNYECGVRINDITLWEGKVEGHKRASGASVLLRRIAAAMEKEKGK